MDFHLHIPERVFCKNLNHRVQWHGDEAVRAIDITLQVSLRAADVATRLVSPDFSDALDDLAGAVKSVTFPVSMERHTVKLYNMHHDVTLQDCDLAKFKAIAEQDGEWLLEFKVQKSDPTDLELATVSHLVACDISADIAPELSIEEPAKDDNQDSMFGDTMGEPDQTQPLHAVE